MLACGKTVLFQSGRPRGFDDEEIDRSSAGVNLLWDVPRVSEITLEAGT